MFYYIDGFIKDEAMLKIMDSFLSVSEQDMPKDAEMFIQKHVPYVEVEILEDFDQVIRNVLSGPACLLLMDIRNVLLLTAGHIRREESMNPIRINRFADQETDL
mgnify:FL=1